MTLVKISFSLFVSKRHSSYIKNYTLLFIKALSQRPTLWYMPLLILLGVKGSLKKKTTNDSVVGNTPNSMG